MFVGVLRLSFGLVGARSLKDKRRVVLSFKERTQARHRVSVAEVGRLDDPRHALLAVAVVANDSRHCAEVLEAVAASASTLGDAVLEDRATEIIAFGPDGRGVRGGIEGRSERLLADVERAYSTERNEDDEP
jgi:uncharacterized protein YlxP (DUF503 family)